MINLVSVASEERMSEPELTGKVLDARNMVDTELHIYNKIVIDNLVVSLTPGPHACMDLAFGQHVELLK